MIKIIINKWKKIFEEVSDAFDHDDPFNQVIYDMLELRSIVRKIESEEYTMKGIKKKLERLIENIEKYFSEQEIKWDGRLLHKYPLSWRRRLKKEDS